MLKVGIGRRSRMNHHAIAGKGIGTDHLIEQRQHVGHITVVWGMNERGVRMAVRWNDRGLARSELVVMRVGNYLVATR